jgi:5-methylcytosine-specific restriction endonuclease McrA
MKTCKTCQLTKPYHDFYACPQTGQGIRKPRGDGYRTECKSCQITRTQRWLANHPSQRKFLKMANAANRRAQRDGVPGHIVVADILALVERDTCKCAYCGSVERITLDHKVGMRLGGPNLPENLQLLCLHCNTVKGHAERKCYHDANPTHRLRPRPVP